MSPNASLFHIITPQGDKKVLELDDQALFFIIQVLSRVLASSSTTSQRFFATIQRLHESSLKVRVESIDRLTTRQVNIHQKTTVRQGRTYNHGEDLHVWNPRLKEIIPYSFQVSLQYVDQFYFWSNSYSASLSVLRQYCVYEFLCAFTRFLWYICTVFKLFQILLASLE